MKTNRVVSRPSICFAFCIIILFNCHNSLCQLNVVILSTGLNPVVVQSLSGLYLVHSRSRVHLNRSVHSLISRDQVQWSLTYVYIYINSLKRALLVLLPLQLLPPQLHLIPQLRQALPLQQQLLVISLVLPLYHSGFCYYYSHAETSWPTWALFICM